ncbi:MAG: hypothetical protein COW59_01395 [Lysobacterales bacterium CG17_big_fil_post_rev_8_21_14_2_50_64_11]|nr:MAG: hypothetical protein COW59_01395 [Xanthomonadales bacterium CG17_big_fil_post_rev_8_21_14_2_50_64_11]PIX61407.1 MAG: hypothetical protein COZ47_02110 [Xanthomonadales bacterium CG_4_10_14_3_um_filter_64_11]
MFDHLRLPVLFVAALLLTACGGGGEVRRIYPPQATIQQLTLLADGGWSLNVRIENFSNVSARIDAIDLKMQIDGIAATTIAITPQRQVSANSVEIFSLDLQPAPAALAAAALAQTDHRGLRYRLDGHITTSDPDDRYPTEFESVLSPVPGLDGVFR